MKKSQIISIIVGAFVAGIILTVFSYQAYTIYEFRAQINNDHAALTQVVDFLNQNIQQAQQAAQAQSQRSGAGVSSQPASSATKK